MNIRQFLRLLKCLRKGHREPPEVDNNGYGECLRCGLRMWWRTPEATQDAQEAADGHSAQEPTGLPDLPLESDLSHCRESVMGWAETAGLSRAWRQGDAVRWEWSQNPTWPHHPQLDWAAGNVMLCHEDNGRLVEWWGDWIKAGYTQQSWGVMHHERGRSPKPNTWICVAAPNRNIGSPVRERTNWVRVI